MNKEKGNFFNIVTAVIIGAILLLSLNSAGVEDIIVSKKSAGTLNILSSYDNSIVEDEIIKYAKSIDKKVSFTYMGDLEIVDELDHNSKEYDAVWISNSMWLYLLDNSYLTSNSKSISISPVVFGITQSKASELNLIGRNVTNTEILNLIREDKINYVMPSVTQTNTGATAYLGFLSSLAGNPEVLTEEMIYDEKLINDLKDVFSGVERVSGDESYLEEMFLKDSSFNAIIASESSLININQKLAKQNKEELYLIYPSDGVAINDSTFAFINNDDDKEEVFLNIQKYLLSDAGKKMLEDNGQRTWYGGVTSKADEEIFNKDWGIDTSKYLNVTKFPSKKVITSAINLYIERLRKPTHVVFCLDYSGSMYGDGETQLKSAMEYILTYEKASKDKLQFSEFDKITVIPFSSRVLNVWSATGQNTNNIVRNINLQNAYGSTALYDAVIRGLNVLEDESDEYTKTIIAMTDGEANVGSFQALERTYKSENYNIPVYSITFGDASEYQLEEIAELTNAKVFDGKTNLLRAFKEVRGYN